jgi:Fe-coproporphyrin III synthase
VGLTHLNSRALRYGVAAGRVLMSNVTRLRVPLKVTWALTYWCQYRCRTCNIWQRKPVDELDTAEALRFVEQNRSISWLDLTGGEIFLRKDVSDILAHLVRTWDRLVLLHFPTNGFLTDKIVDCAERIAGRSAARIIITVSVDGDATLNDRVRGIKGGFERQMETFRALRSVRGVRPVFGMTLSRDNVGAFEQTFRACQAQCPELTIDDFHLNVAQLSSHYYGNAQSSDVLADRDSARAALRLYRSKQRAPTSVAAWLEGQYLQHLDTYLQTGEQPLRCHSLRSSCFIDPWGTVFPCITYERPIGSLRDTDMALAPVWDGVEARQRQSEIWQGDCPRCWTACEAYPTVLGHLLWPASPVSTATDVGGHVNVRSG